MDFLDQRVFTYLLFYRLFALKNGYFKKSRYQPKLEVVDSIIRSFI